MNIGDVLTLAVLFIAASLSIRALRLWMRWRAAALKRTETARENAGKCPRCGYDLTGLNALQCPECGVVIPKRIATDHAQEERRMAQARQKVAEAYAKRKEPK